MTKKIEDKNYTFFMGYKQLTGNSRIGFKKEVLFDKGDGIIFFESEKSLYKKKKEGDADQYEMRGDNIVYYELSDAQMDNHSEKDSYVKEEDDKKQKKNWMKIKLRLKNVKNCLKKKKSTKAKESRFKKS